MAVNTRNAPEHGLRSLILFAAAIAAMRTVGWAQGVPPAQSTAVAREVRPAPHVRDTHMPIGIFESHEDVGAVLHRGSVDYDPAARSYTVAGSGENMWSTQDAFHYAWKRASGDLALSADVAFLGRGVEPHRKACLVIRQS